MTPKITTIPLQLPFRLGSVNCYLIETASAFILVDTGSSNQRAHLLKELERCGCQPGNLRLLVITHGDFDHTGNAAFLRGRFGASIAMHAGDSGMAERGDMFWNRKKGNALIRFLAPRLFGFTQADRFQPDLLIDEGFDLSEYGLDAKILSIPGHSRGSIGLLVTSSGPSPDLQTDLFCGDLLENTSRPALNTIMDDPDSALASVERLNGSGIKTVYPGHGAAWEWFTLRIDPASKS